MSTAVEVNVRAAAEALGLTLDELADTLTRAAAHYLEVAAKSNLDKAGRLLDAAEEAKTAAFSDKHGLDEVE